MNYWDLDHLLQSLVVHVVGRPVHVVTHPVVQVVEVLLGDHVVPVQVKIMITWSLCKPRSSSSLPCCSPVDIKDVVEEMDKLVLLES